MKWTKTYIPTLREKQADAELISHQLLLRGGYIRRLASGIYIYLPLMQRVIEKFAQIVREEMNATGALEITMPVLCPADYWHKSGRYEVGGKDLMKMLDRHEKEFVMCGTHEETITSLVAGEVKSYRQLPLNMYQIQVKFRDEIRPRFGLMRGREFLMKDAYTFDASKESFVNSYQKMVEAYYAIFKRAGLEVVKVEADTGAMGGEAAHEFMLLVDTQAGDQTIFFCDKCDYAANIEKAEFKDRAEIKTESDELAMETVDTPGAATIEEVSAFFKVEPRELVKTLLYIADDKPVAALVRGDRELSEFKFKNATAAAFLRMATAAEVEELSKARVGFAGPIGLSNVKIYVDSLVSKAKNFIVGANANEKHIKNVNLGRDFEAFQICDITSAASGDSCPNCDGKLSTKRGIELGNTFMLGTKYSETLGAKFLDSDGKEHPILMGSYGIGITRTPQAALEKYCDDKGIIWPKNIAPYLVQLIPLKMDSPEQGRAADKIYEALREAGIEVLYDDRNDRPGVKFNDADLIGLPIRITIGDKFLKDNKVELKARAEADMELVEVEKVVEAVTKLADKIN